MYSILLFYKYVSIKNPKAELERQRAAWELLDLKGRMIIAEEGINATCEGTIENISKYKEWLTADKRFSNIHFKESAGTGKAFPKRSIKVRSEIVSLHLGKNDFNPNRETGIRLKPEDLKKWYEDGKEFYIVDMRNDYELAVGKFDGTIFPGLKNFRDLPLQIKEIEPLKDKTVLTVCTGGVRCEKASGFLKRQGFNEVYQLDGGIVSFMEKFPGQHFQGSLYVFDNRITMHFDKPDKHTVIGSCIHCGVFSERYVNCTNMLCHKHFICCEKCGEESTYCNDCQNKKVEASIPAQLSA